MLDLSSVDTSVLNKMAFILGISFFGVFILALLLEKLLEVLKIPKALSLPLVRVGAVFGFLYLVVALGEKYM
ncbi:hypothetical protein ABE65_016260 [Fictibacillus phosphorivorans]|uniref:Uncharacterized protein n=1 Tax=Fictibacillus phosphorivorans TaxID=1221500 RepID=A0A161J7B6_9BACL|nr:hypothetical protein [Fictibacillus phosphorivorans]ANC78269.1 hypothetical protein ABE65_016260 [Fictibacillus phosphorivorans]